MPFIVSAVSAEEDLKEIYRLRYKVYCEEWGYEKPEHHPKGVESDEFDKHSVHFAVRDESHKIVGTIRLILFSPDGFPIEKYCESNTDLSDVPRERTAEISRLAISKEYRKRKEDKYIYGPDEDRRMIGNVDYQQKYNSKFYYRRSDDRYRFRPAGMKTSEFPYDRRNRHEIVADLYKAIYHESKKRGITHWYAIMTKGLLTLLRRFGFNFQAIGDPVDYHGIRTPYLGEIEKIEQEVLEKNPGLYEEFTKGL